MIGNITLTYKPIEGLTITNNAGTDFYTEGRRKLYAKGTVGALMVSSRLGICIKEL